MKFFLWYDLETTGADSSSDRIVQYASIRTDKNFVPVSEPVNIECSLSFDVYPSIYASMVTGQTPLKACLNEKEGLEIIQNDFIRSPDTCIAGYNNFHFDNELIRHSFYRNFLPPYAHEFMQNNSKMDAFILTQALYALRPQGIEWPKIEGIVSLKLENIARVNHIEQTKAHDALFDVEATIEWVKLIKSKQPKLFDFYLKIQNKHILKDFCLDASGKLKYEKLVHISSFYGRDVAYVGIILPIFEHPYNTNSLICINLFQSISEIEKLLDEDIEVNFSLPALTEIRLNRAPFLAPMNVLREEDCSRLRVELSQVEKNFNFVLCHLSDFQKLKDKMRPFSEKNSDVEQQLYDGFISQKDARQAELFRSGVQGSLISFQDARLRDLSLRYRMRFFSDGLNKQELKLYEEHAYCSRFGRWKPRSLQRSLLEMHQVYFSLDVQNHWKLFWDWFYALQSCFLYDDRVIWGALCPKTSRDLKITFAEKSFICYELPQELFVNLKLNADTLSFQLELLGLNFYTAQPSCLSEASELKTICKDLSLDDSSMVEDILSEPALDFVFEFGRFFEAYLKMPLKQMYLESLECQRIFLLLYFFSERFFIFSECFFLKRIIFLTGFIP